MLIYPAASLQRFYVLSISDKNPEIWTSPHHLRLGIRTRRSIPTRPIYLWDLHYLGAMIKSDTIDGFYTLDLEDANWNPLWVSSFSDNAGDKIVETLPVAFPVNVFNRLSPTNYNYSGSFQFSPLLTALEETIDPDTGLPVVDEYGQPVLVMEPETSLAEKAIWNATVNPAYPLLFATSIENHKMFGPNLCTNINYSVTGQDTLGQVIIKAGWSGGKSVLAPTIPTHLPETMTIDELTDTEEYSHSYRRASFQDCALIHEVFTDKQELLDSMIFLNLLEKINPYERIVQMSLDVSQTIELIYPSLYEPYTIEHGPRFAALTNRKVKGEISYYSRSAKLPVELTSELTMYFGGDFLFAMPNVEWQKPSITVTPGIGYTHILPFIARAAPNAVALPFQEASLDRPVSEFKITELDNTTDSGEE